MILYRGYAMFMEMIVRTVQALEGILKKTQRKGTYHIFGGTMMK